MFLQCYTIESHRKNDDDEDEGDYVCLCCSTYSSNRVLSGLTIERRNLPHVGQGTVYHLMTLSAARLFCAAVIRLLFADRAPVVMLLLCAKLDHPRLQPPSFFLVI